MLGKKYIRPFLMFDPNDGNGGNDGDLSKKGETPDAAEESGGKQQNQEDLNRQYAERAKRAAETQKKALYEALGVKDDAEFDAYLKAKKEAEDKQKSETEKLAEQARKAQEALEKLKGETGRQLEEMRKRVLDTEIRIAASAEEKDKDGKTLRAAFLPEALDDVVLLTSRSKIEEKDDGTFAGIDKALAELAKQKPYLLASAQKPEQGKGTPRGPVGKKLNLEDRGEEDGLWFKSL